MQAPAGELFPVETLCRPAVQLRGAGIFSNPLVSMRTYVTQAMRMMRTAKRKIQATQWPDSEAELLYDLCEFILGGLDVDHGGDRFGGYYGEKLKDTKEGKR